MILQDLYKQIETEYALKQQNAKHLCALRQEEIYRKIPQMKELDSTINTLGVLIGYAAMKRRPPEKLLSAIMDDRVGYYLSMNAQQLNDEIKQLNIRKQQLLKTNGYSEAYLDEVFDCNICRDTGFIHVPGGDIPCGCRERIVAAKLKEAAGIPTEEVFSAFRCDLYPEDTAPAKYGISVSPRVQMEAIYNRCIRFSEHFTDKEIHSMMFVGSSGLGKTFLGNCIMNELTDRGISCLYMPATSLFKPFAPGFYGQEKAAETVEFIMNCELLLIDDLGSEKQSGARYGELLEILNNRMLRGRNTLCKTIITTNLTPANIFSYYGERVASRILGSFDILKFAGEDIRLKLKCAY